MQKPTHLHTDVSHENTKPEAIVYLKGKKRRKKQEKENALTQHYDTKYPPK